MHKDTIDKNNIIIVGYPKSGTTWASRLVAELVGCPLKGDWGYATVDAAYQEGLQRHSAFQCFKSHHSRSEIEQVSNLPIDKMIYIVRDPRDIVISSVAYFNFALPLLVSLLKKLRVGKFEHGLKRRGNFLISTKEKKRQMIKSLLYGSEEVSYWLKTPWQQHYQPYLDPSILFIKYENLLTNPTIECVKIMAYLELKTSAEHIEKSIAKQSFTTRKQQLTDTPAATKDLTKLLRKGSQGYWKQQLTAEEIALFARCLKNNNAIYQF